MVSGGLREIERPFAVIASIESGEVVPHSPSWIGGSVFAVTWPLSTDGHAVWWICGGGGGADDALDAGSVLDTASALEGGSRLDGAGSDVGASLALAAIADGISTGIGALNAGAGRSRGSGTSLALCANAAPDSATNMRMSG